MQQKRRVEAVIFFTFVQSLYNFLSSSTNRWNVLKSYVQKSNEGKPQSENKTVMLKSLSDTRWSARADALRALVISHGEIKNSLEDLMNDKTQTPDTRLTAQGLIKTLNNFQTNLITVLWNEILQ